MVTRNTRKDPEFFRFDMNNFTDYVFITNFDINKQKRLIVDGLHRANALTIACEERINIPKVRKFDSYGDKVKVIFPVMRTNFSDRHAFYG